MINKLVFNNLQKSMRKFTLQRPMFSFSENKKQNLNENKNNQEQKFTSKIWPRIFFLCISGLFAHQIYNIIFKKQRVLKEVDNKGTITMKLLYPFVKIPFIFQISQWIVWLSVGFIEFLKNPVQSQKMLGNSINQQSQKKTLALNLTGTLLTQQYVSGKGRMLIIRPGLDKLLAIFSDKYQIIIWSNDNYKFIAEALPRINNIYEITGVFGKQWLSWNFADGYYRDPRFLNRNLKNIIVIDSKKELSKYFPNNALILSEFTGNTEDKQIDKVIALLNKILVQKVKDVRALIKNFNDNQLKYQEDKHHSQKKI